ncbi:MAG: hypothetical protein HZB23_01550 [Deltaproteobacteria bacterium]|nr:hypothetical protein [Deltaproteobacteria bacterium]
MGWEKIFQVQGKWGDGPVNAGGYQPVEKSAMRSLDINLNLGDEVQRRSSRF